MKEPLPPPAPGDKSFRWDCPYCVRPHLSRIPSDAAVGDRVNTRCPSNGLWVETKVAEIVSPAARDPSSQSQSRLGGILRWLRELNRMKK